MPFSLLVPRRPRPLQWALLPTLGIVFLPGIAAANPAGLATNVSLLAVEPLAGGTITGRVVDASGEGLPGVTVVLEGTSLGASTDATGAYSISNVPAGSYTLVTSYVGFKANRTPITVTEGGTTAVPVATLAENTTLLKEAVVIGYG